MEPNPPHLARFLHLENDAIFRRSHLIYGFGGWQYIHACDDDAERAARFTALMGSRYGKYRAYLFTVPNAKVEVIPETAPFAAEYTEIATPTPVEFDREGRPINLPRAAARYAKLFVGGCIFKHDFIKASLETEKGQDFYMQHIQRHILTNEALTLFEFAEHFAL